MQFFIKVGRSQFKTAIRNRIPINIQVLKVLDIFPENSLIKNENTNIKKYEKYKNLPIPLLSSASFKPSDISSLLPVITALRIPLLSSLLTSEIKFYAASFTLADNTDV